MKPSRSGTAEGCSLAGSRGLRIDEGGWGNMSIWTRESLAPCESSVRGSIGIVGSSIVGAGTDGRREIGISTRCTSTHARWQNFSRDTGGSAIVVISIWMALLRCLRLLAQSGASMQRCPSARLSSIQVSIRDIHLRRRS